MAREPIMAAGGIVLRREQPPLVAVVRLRKRDEWVLPKGKLDAGETARDAAKREVLEETGHEVTVHEFLGTLVHDNNVRAKIVHYWRMEALSSKPSRDLMDDVRAVDWLPLDDAVERLSRVHEKTFLESVGPYALAGLIRRTKAKPVADAKPTAVGKSATASKPAAPGKAGTASKPEAAAKSATGKTPARKRRSRVTEQPPMEAPLPVGAEPAASPELPAAPAELLPVIVAADTAPEPAVAEIADAVVDATASDGPAAAVDAAPGATEMTAEPEGEAMPASEQEATAPQTLLALGDVARVEAVTAELKSLVAGAAAAAPQPAEVAPEPTAAELPANATEPASPKPRSLAQKMRAWLGRAA